MALAAAQQYVTAENAFKMAAFLYAGSVPGHFQYGYTSGFLREVDAVIPAGKGHDMLRTATLGSWQYTNVGFALAGAFNWQWSQSNGPQAFYEFLCFWFIFWMGVGGGRRFIKIGYYQPLNCLWYGTFFQALGLLLVYSDRLAQYNPLAHYDQLAKLALTGL